MSVDYYAVLGVDKNATDSDIKKAYRKLIKANHPDTKTTEQEKEEAKKKTAEINEAYEVLSNKEKREQYDRYGSVGDFNNNFTNDDIESIIREHMRNSGFGGGFGGGFGFGGFNSNRQRRNEPPLKGQNLRISISIKLSEFLIDRDKKITYKRSVKCSDCNGTGTKNGAKSECPYCNGSGMEVKTYRQGNSIYQEQTVCSHCRGTGEYIEPNNRCSKCNGTGFINKEETIDIHIKKGNMNDVIISNRGNDSLNTNGVAGDLIITFNIINDSKDICGNKYIIQNANGDLGLILEVGYATMTLGSTIKLKDINNKEFNVDIPANTTDSTILRIKGHGMTDNNMLLIQLLLKDSSKISEEEKKILEELKKLEKLTN